MGWIYKKGPKGPEYHIRETDWNNFIQANMVDGRLQDFRCPHCGKAGTGDSKIVGSGFWNIKNDEYNEGWFKQHSCGAWLVEDYESRNELEHSSLRLDRPFYL